MSPLASVSAFVGASLALALAAALAGAQPVAPVPLPPSTVPTVAVSASATATIPNDRLHAWLRAEAENPSAAAAASEVNARMGKVLARVKTASGVTAQTSGYSTNQVYEKGKPSSRWRVVQSVKLEGGDFPAIAALVAKLQEEDGLLLSGLNFSVSEEARRKAEDSVTLAAIKSWQQRVQNATQGLGYTTWRAGRVNVQTADAPRLVPMARGDVAFAAETKAPMALEAGTTDVTVTVSGEALIEGPKR